MKMLLGLSEALPSLVEAKYKTAKASHALVFSSTELAVIRTSAGVPFQLRYCPALARKPEPRKDATPKRKIDPFENPPKELFITDLPTTDPSHLLVLNKFPVIANHFIIATKANKRQTHLLEEDDLAATYACLNAWEEGPGSRQNRLFAFFNSGAHSGASQPHRHLQFLPVNDMHEGEKSSGWDPLINSTLSSVDGASQPADVPPSTLQHPTVPFTHFAYSFPTEISAARIFQAYTDLYKLAEAAIDDFIAANPSQLALHSTIEGDLPISYNLAMTTSGMAILPRRSEGYMLRHEDGTEIGFVELNGTALGGTLMVKCQEEWEALRARPETLDAILEAIGIPRTSQMTRL
ncbi:HIT-like protein [Lentithecium fluviatile CBS 122367]|uniref:HIT-like protein n=1 Tax=Lentithecium fluviatile CBS 122367 TaxID=1168545 RepID=A0A6G1JP22_9PLEO|nr:HIT-like protein [Lentithecium fluviatile CBS 122367]